MTKENLISALEKNAWYVKPTAESLGIDRSTVNKLMVKFGIEKRRIRGERPNRPEWSCCDKNDFIKARNTWYKMVKRCYQISNSDYANYGGRGIGVYVAWKNSLDVFYNYCKTLDNAFKPGFTIDRIDNNGNYEPGNIRFASHKVQCNNKRSNRSYTYKNKTQNISQWAEEYNLKWEFIRDRLELGFTIEEALTIPRYGRKSI